MNKAPHAESSHLQSSPAALLRFALNFTLLVLPDILYDYCSVS